MINNCTLLGRLVADPELKTTNANTSMVRFRIAVDRDFTKEGEEKKTDFIPCVAWRSTADFINKYFKKGDMIAIVGKLNIENYEKDGEKRSYTNVAVEKVSFCGERRKEQNGAPATESAPAPAKPDIDIPDFDEEELPF